MGRLAAAIQMRAVGGQKKQVHILLFPPNLPVIHQFRGNESRNLPLKEVWQLQSNPAIGTQKVYQKT